jgi:hypothetical protein
MIYLLTDSVRNTGPRSIGAYRIATVLRNHNYQVEVLDFLSYWNPDDIIKYIDSGPQPLWIGFSSTFTGPNKDVWMSNGQMFHDCLTHYGFKENEFWNKLKSRAPIILGGARTERLKYFYNADFVVSGYADSAVIPITEYITGLNKNLKYKVETIKSLKYPNTKYDIKSINCEEFYPVTDVSNITTEFHDSDFIQPGEVLPIEISRGCIFKCTFCAFPLNGKTKNDYIRPKEQILRDIELYKKKYSSDQYIVLDDTFNDTIEKMQMMKEIYDQTGGFNFWSYGRLDLIAAKPEMLHLIDKIGWKYFSFGIETFNRQAGKKIGKGADPDKLKETLKKIKQQYPKSWLLFEMIVGLPGETRESIDTTIEWFSENRDLWNEVHFKELFVANGKFQAWKSQMTEQPEKFGLKVINIENSNAYGLKWQHDTMNTDQARNLSSEITEKINKIKPRRINNYFIELYKNVGAVDKNTIRESFIKYLDLRADNYIKSKLKSRNLL